MLMQIYRILSGDVNDIIVKVVPFILSYTEQKPSVLNLYGNINDKNHLIFDISFSDNDICITWNNLMIIWM